MSTRHTRQTSELVSPMLIKQSSENLNPKLEGLSLLDELENEEIVQPLSSKEIKEIINLRKAPIVVPSEVQKVYKLIRKHNGGLGGNGYHGAIYGELTIGSMQRVINFLISDCEMTHRSRFIDVGSGLGKPNFHAAQCPKVRLSIGVELEDIRWKLGIHNLHCILPHITSTTNTTLPTPTPTPTSTSTPTPILTPADLNSENIPPVMNQQNKPSKSRKGNKQTAAPESTSLPPPKPLINQSQNEIQPPTPVNPISPAKSEFGKGKKAVGKGKGKGNGKVAEKEEEPQAAVPQGLNGGIHFICDDIDSANSLDPFTHIYMFDLGFPPPLQQSIARKFNRSVHSRYLVSYRPPYRVIPEYGYDVEFVHQLLTSMHGSGEGHTAYFYKKKDIHSSPAAEVRDVTHKVLIPAREQFDEEDEEVWCDVAFKRAVELAVGDLEALRDSVAVVEKESMESGRPKRERKPRIF